MDELQTLRDAKIALKRERILCRKRGVGAKSRTKRFPGILAARPGGVANVTFLTTFRLAERLGAGALAAVGRRPVNRRCWLSRCEPCWPRSPGCAPRWRIIPLRSWRWSPPPGSWPPSLTRRSTP